MSARSCCCVWAFSAVRETLWATPRRWTVLNCIPFVAVHRFDLTDNFEWKIKEVKFLEFSRIDKCAGIK